MPETGYAIRPATSADARGIAKVHVATWQATYRGIVPQAHLDGMSIERSAGKWEESLVTPGSAASFVLVAEAGNAFAQLIVGFVKAGAERSGKADYPGEVHAIYVSPEHQGRGIGRQLMTAAAHGLQRRGWGALLVWVLKENAPSRHFYERLGGQVLTEQPLVIGGIELIEVAYGWADLAAAFGKPPAGAVVVTSYDPRWPADFEAIRAHVSPALGDDLVARIEHVGSTSVPGLAAKPIIDIDVLLRDPTMLDEAIRRLAAIDYEHEGERGIPTRHAFRHAANQRRRHLHEWPAHHLYVCTSPGGAFAEHVAFRDYLRAHCDEAARYGALKIKLAREHPNDRERYMAGKDSLVKELLRRAMWVSNDGR